MTHTILLTAILAALLISLTYSVSFQSLYDRELKSSYGFEILKHYHNENFGSNDVKHFNGESMLFMTPWYFILIIKAITRHQPLPQVHEKV